MLRRYFQAQSLFSVPTKMILIVAPINLLLNYTLGMFPLPHNSLCLIDRSLALVLGPPSVRLGFIGAPISTAICQYILLILHYSYAYFYVSRRAWHPLFTRQMFTHLDVVIRLGLSGIGQLATEWWAWELVALAASFLGPIALASQSVLLTTGAMTFQLVIGISNATAMRIGNLLGEKKAKRAEIASKAAIGLTFIASSATCLMLIIFRKSWAYMFASDPSIVALVSSVLPTIALFQIFEGKASVTAAILRAKGQQFIGAVLTVTGYYCIGLPIGVYLAFKKEMGLQGLWIGLTVSLVYCAVSGLWIALRTDWEEEVRKVLRRLKEEQRLRDVLKVQNEEEGLSSTS
jgi:multidrug resistance protein, MATE family